MKEIKDMTTLELASFVCVRLEERGIKTTLSGGYCAEIYSMGQYTSFDIDLISSQIGDSKEISKAMLELGFKQEGRYFYHEDSEYAIEFPSGALMVGNEVVKETATIHTDVGTLRLLTATDAVKDRLSSFYHWDSEQTLEQALMIAKQNKVDLENIKEWSKKEKCLDKFEIFKKHLMCRENEKLEKGDFVKRTVKRKRQR